MNIFYSKTKLNNNIVMPTSNNDVKIVKSNNNTIFYDDSNKIVGFNIHIEKELPWEGRLYPTEEILQIIKNNIHQEINCTTKGFIVGEIIEAEKIEGTHLTKCRVDISSDVLDIVCGAKNARKGIRVVVATTGVIMPSGLLIKPSKLKGFDSNGMLCSQKELNLDSFNDSGIIELGNEYKIGAIFKQIYKNL